MNLTHQHNIVLPLLDLAILATYIGVVVCLSNLVKMAAEHFEDWWLDRKAKREFDASRNGVGICVDRCGMPVSGDDRVHKTSTWNCQFTCGMCEKIYPGFSKQGLCEKCYKVALTKGVAEKF